ncbi:uncharacterized protein LOC136753818 [Amia ocellicauda]|uniref:uncharacterized protein LOC136753818 n=1 Tax=Amia ocellicauda TaxID=2972642 RepID=UPI00346472F5
MKVGVIVWIVLLAAFLIFTALSETSATSSNGGDTVNVLDDTFLEASKEFTERHRQARWKRNVPEPGLLLVDTNTAAPITTMHEEGSGYPETETPTTKPPTSNTAPTVSSNNVAETVTAPTSNTPTVLVTDTTATTTTVTTALATTNKITNPILITEGKYLNDTNTTTATSTTQTSSAATSIETTEFPPIMPVIAVLRLEFNSNNPAANESQIYQAFTDFLAPYTSLGIYPVNVTKITSDKPKATEYAITVYILINELNVPEGSSLNNQTFSEIQDPIDALFQEILSELLGRKQTKFPSAIFRQVTS